MERFGDHHCLKKIKKHKYSELKKIYKKKKTRNRNWPSSCGVLLKLFDNNEKKALGQAKVGLRERYSYSQGYKKDSRRILLKLFLLQFFKKRLEIWTTRKTHYSIKISTLSTQP